MENLDKLLTQTGVLGFHFHPADGDKGPGEWQFNIKSASAQRSYIGPGSEAIAFTRKALGGYALNNQNQIEFNPEYTCFGAPWLVAKDATIRFHGAISRDATTKELTWKYAVVTLQFKSVEYENDNQGRGIKRSIRSANEILTIEGGTGTFPSGEKASAPIPIEVMSFEMRYEYEHAPDDGVHLLPLAGKVNNAPWQGLPAGTVLFSHYEADVNQKGMQEVTESRRSYTFKYRDVPHNKHFNPTTGNFETLTFPGNRLTYLATDFTGVFD